MTGIKILFHLTILNVFVHSNEIMLQDIMMRPKYNTAECINNILTKYFPCGTYTTYVNKDVNVNKLIRDTNEDDICHSIIMRTFDDRDWYIWTDVYVITTDNLLEIMAGMTELTMDVFWNPRAKFIVQVTNLNDDSEIHELFEMMLKYKVYNMILLKVYENDATIHTYFPFSNSNCGKNFEEVITLGNCEDSEYITNYFPNDVPNEIQNCTIKVVATDDVPNFISISSNYTVYGKYVSGLEQYVLDTIGSRLGFYIEYDVFDEDEIYYGIVLPNGTSTGLLSYIDRGIADVAAGGYVLMKNRVELFDYLYGFNYASYNLYTPVVGNQAWKRLYREFSATIWTLISGAFILVGIVCLILKIALNDKTFSFLNLWGYFFSNANIGMSKDKTFRSIIFFWSWFTFFIISFYNTALFSLLTVHVHESPHTIDADNLKTLPYKSCISDNSRMFFQFAFNQKLPEGEPIHNCTYTDGALQYVSATKNYYAIEMEYSYKLKEYEYLNEEGKHQLESWIFSSSNVIVMYLVRGFPFKNIFQRYASWMYEAGLIKNHMMTIHLRSYSVVKRHPKTFVNTTTPDLRMHFCVLFCGYILSMICFAFEIFWYKCTKVENKRKLK